MRLVAFEGHLREAERQQLVVAYRLLEANIDRRVQAEGSVVTLLQQFRRHLYEAHTGRHGVAREVCMEDVVVGIQAHLTDQVCFRAYRAYDVEEVADEFHFAMSNKWLSSEPLVLTLVSFTVVVSPDFSSIFTLLTIVSSVLNCTSMT